VIQASLTVERLLTLIPPLEELDGLRSGIARAAIPDWEARWARSGTHATVDMRVVVPESLEPVVREAEETLHRYVASLFATYRAVLHTFCAGDHANTIESLIQLGEEQERYERPRHARQFYDAALALSLPLPEKSLQILASRRIGRAALAASEFDEAWGWYQRSATLARDAGDPQGEVVGWTGCGNVRAFQGRWTEAEECYQRALERLKTQDGAEWADAHRAQLYNNLGMVTTRQNCLDEAERWLSLVFDLRDSLQSPSDRAAWYHDLGTLRGKQERHQEAREFFHRALETAVAPAVCAVVAIDLAMSYLEDRLFHRAEDWARKAEEHAIAARSPYSIGRVYLGRGNIARAQGAEGGLTFYEKALEIARDKDLRALEGEVLLDYALLRKQMGGMEEAQAYLEHARTIFSELGEVHDRTRAEQEIGRLLQAE
jgi:tetratricopeptide (TPR) repeat protein